MTTPTLDSNGGIPKLPDSDLLEIAQRNAGDTDEFLRQLDDMERGARSELAGQREQMDNLRRETEQAGDLITRSSEKPQTPSILQRLFGGGGSSGNSAANSDKATEIKKDEPKEAPSGSSSPVTQTPSVADEVVPKLDHILAGPNNPQRGQLIDLLRAGKITEFNRMRPSGRIDFRGLDLSGHNLEGVDFRHVDLSRASLRAANLKGALFQHAIVDRADFGRSTLTDANFFKIEGRYADFREIVSASGAKFQRANLRSSDFSLGNFNGANFNDAIMITATCTGARFRGPATHMERVCLAGAVLSEASFAGANLTQARLFQANGEDVDFSGTNLIQAEAVQSHFLSTGQKSVQGKVLQTTFAGAWVRGFVHHGSISAEMLHGSISDRTPPEGAFENAKEPDPGKILINNVPGTDKVLYDAAMMELNELVGMYEAKDKVRKLTTFVEASQTRQGFGLPPYKIWLHKVLLGPPGVGKTTLARIMAQLEHSLALRKKGHLVETDKSGLIAGYAGQTLGKTTEVIDSAMDGTLLIDEAYALGQSKDDAYAKDATAVIVKRMWDDRERLTVTFAGYEEETEDFVNSNPGMRSRIGLWIKLKPFTSGELVDIFKLNLDKQVTRYDAKLLGAVSVLLEIAREKEGKKFGNARSVEKTVNDLNFKHSARLKDQNLMQNEKAHKSSPLIEDLPFNEVASIEFSEVPPLDEFRWVDKKGKEYSIDELPLDDEFPAMSEKSLELIKKLA